MYMELSTGSIKPQGEKYGIDNLKKIVRACVNIGKVIAHVRSNPVPQKFWGKVWYWIKSLFAQRAVFADIGQDLVQLAANGEVIKAELMDLNGIELEQLIGLLTYEANIDNPERFLKTLPVLLDAIRAMADIIK